MEKRVYIAGGSGMIGSRLSDKLAEMGCTVRTISRKPRGTALSYDKDILTKEFSGAWAVINLAGSGIADRKWTDDYKKTILESRTKTTKLLAECINSAEVKPEVFFSASAVGYYGNTNEDEIDEESPAGKGFLADVCKAWEDAAQVAKGTRTVIGRIGIVLDRTQGALAKMLPSFKMFAGGSIGSGKQWMAWIHIEDIINAIAYLLESDISGPVNLTGPRPARMEKFARVLGKIIHRPSYISVPAFALKLLMGEAAVIVLEGQKAYPNKLTGSGFEFKFPKLQAAIENLLRKY